MKGDPSDDFAAFYDAWRGPLRRGLALAIGSAVTADEAIDEAMARALEHWDRIRHYDKPEGWVYRVGLNWARDLFRKRRFELLTDLPPEWTTHPDYADDLDVIEAVGRLPLRFRSIVVARYYLDWSTTEVAAALEIPEGTVKSRLARGLARLAVELEEST